MHSDSSCFSGHEILSLLGLKLPVASQRTWSRRQNLNNGLMYILPTAFSFLILCSVSLYRCPLLSSKIHSLAVVIQTHKVQFSMRSLYQDFSTGCTLSGKLHPNVAHPCPPLGLHSNISNDCITS